MANIFYALRVPGTCLYAFQALFFFNPKLWFGHYYNHPHCTHGEISHRKRKLPKFTHLLSGRPWIWTQESKFWSPDFLIPLLHRWNSHLIQKSRGILWKVLLPLQSACFRFAYLWPQLQYAGNDFYSFLMFPFWVF